MKLTPQQLQQLKDAKIRRKELLIKMEADKKTHQWNQSWVFERWRGAAIPMLGCCKKCGVDYTLFKYNPTPCPK